MCMDLLNTVMLMKVKLKNAQDKTRGHRKHIDGLGDCYFRVEQIPSCATPNLDCTTPVLLASSPIFRLSSNAVHFVMAKSRPTNENTTILNLPRV